LVWNYLRSGSNAVVTLEIKITGHGIHHCYAYRFLLIHESAHQAMLAKQIHHTRDAAGITVDCSQGLGIKNLLAVRSRNSQPLMNVRPAFFSGEGMSLGPKCQSLL